MVYYDNSGRRIRRRVKRSTPTPDSGLDNAKTRYIRRAAGQHPGFTPDEVHAEIYYGRGQRDITKNMVRVALG